MVGAERVKNHLLLALEERNAEASWGLQRRQTVFPDGFSQPLSGASWASRAGWPHPGHWPTFTRLAFPLDGLPVLLTVMGLRREVTPWEIVKP